MSDPTTIDEYLGAVPPNQRAALQKVRKAILQAAPEVEETIGYKIPSFKYRGRPLVYFAAFKNHCSFFGASLEVLDTYANELEPFRTSKGTLQFTQEAPIPDNLVKKIVRAKKLEIDRKVDGKRKK